jgi:FkbM family methyltransferase
MDFSMTLIYDIGFNKGEFAQACFDKHTNCKVVGVEANKDLFYSAPKRENLILLNNLVSDKDNEMVEFFIEFGQTGISTASKDFMENSRFKKGSKYLQPNSGKWINAGKIPTITLDSMIKQYGSPNIIKVDVEGYEYNVLKGLTQRAGKICFECHEEEKEKLENIVEHLISIGYTEFGLIGYFEEGDVFGKLTFSELGDPYLIEPGGYYRWNDIKKEISSCFKEDRRINYGMVWCK